MGTSEINGKVQSKTKTECKSSISSSLLCQRRLVGIVFHANTETAALSRNSAGLFRSCQVDYSANGKIRDTEGWWIHRSSASGTESMHLNFEITFCYIYQDLDILMLTSNHKRQRHKNKINEPTKIMASPTTKLFVALFLIT